MVWGMPHRTKRRFGDLERSVLDVLWGATDWLTVREIHAHLAESRPIAYTTVMTVLDRMTPKGLVTRERSGRAFRYRAAGSRAEMTAEVMREALHNIAAHDRESALVAFVGEASPEELVMLRQAIDDHPHGGAS